MQGVVEAGGEKPPAIRLGGGYTILLNFYQYQNYSFDTNLNASNSKSLGCLFNEGKL